MNNRTYLMRFFIAVSMIVLLSGCAGNETQGTEMSLTEDTMTGMLLRIDTQKRELRLNISNWVNRGKTEVDDMMHSITVTYNEKTIFQDEQGSVVHPEDFKIGEKLAVLPTSDTASSNRQTASVADEIIQLKMSKEEKLDRFLARGDNFHTVVLYEEDTTPPYDEMDFNKYVPESFSGGISWIPYVKGLAVDYKKELGIEKLPVIIVFDRNGAVFQTDSMEQLKAWSDENR